MTYIVRSKVIQRGISVVIMKLGREYVEKDGMDITVVPFVYQEMILEVIMIVMRQMGIKYATKIGMA